MLNDKDENSWVSTPIPGRNDVGEEDDSDGSMELEDLEMSDELSLINELSEDESSDDENADDTDENDVDDSEEPAKEDEQEEEEADSKEDEVQDSSKEDKSPTDEEDDKEERAVKGKRAQKRIQSLAREKNEWKAKFEESQKQWNSEKSTRVEAEKASVESKKKHLDEQVEILSNSMKEAMDLGDSEKFVEHQKLFNTASMQRMAIDNVKFEEVPTQEEFAKANQQAPEAPEMSAEGLEWIETNREKLQDPFNKSVAVTISNQLDAEGYDENSTIYFKELSKRLGAKLVDFREGDEDTVVPKKKPKTTKRQVTSGSATTPAPHNKNGLPVLTDVQKYLAKEMGLTVKQYATQLKVYNKAGDNQKYVNVKVR